MASYSATGFSGSIGSPFSFDGALSNGTYTSTGSTINGFPSYTNGTHFIWSHDGTGGRCNLTDANGGGNVAYYNPTVTSADPSTGTWLNNPGGLTPGTITEISASRNASYFTLLDVS